MLVLQENDENIFEMYLSRIKADTKDCTIFIKLYLRIFENAFSKENR